MRNEAARQCTWFRLHLGLVIEVNPKRFISRPKSDERRFRLPTFSKGDTAAASAAI